MLKLIDPEELFDLPVSVKVPGQEAEHDCTLKVHFLPSDETAKLMLKGDGVFFQRIVKGWAGIQTHRGADLPYSDDNRTLLSNVTYFARALGDAYTRWAAGLPAKNSATSPSRS